MPPLQPREDYRARLERWRTQHTTSQSQFRKLGNARLITGLTGAVIAGIAFGPAWLSPWWLLAPLAVFLVLSVKQDRAGRSASAGARGVVCYERALARVENRWVGGGNQGEQFRDPKHVYADDLDLFGRGSLFELLSTARTATGDRKLAEWLLGPGDRVDVCARQEAVAELRPRTDLREYLSMMGEDIRAAIDDRALRTWGEQPAEHLPPAVRWVALLLGAAALVSFILFLAQVVSAVPFLVSILVQLMFRMFVRERANRVTASVSTPGKEMELLGLLLQRIEEESFITPHLVRLREELRTEGRAASVQIRRLKRVVEYLDWTRNQFFGVPAAAVMWDLQCAIAIETWRLHCGPHIGPWISAVGEFEALCSLAAFAYERPLATFPELLEQQEPLFDATQLAHPLIPPDEAVANDVSIGGPVRLWIVSGSNMSGKSTLLRAVGLNVVLAWAGAPVTASRLRVSRLYTGVSMRANDSVTDHRSRFYAEITRLREVVDLARAGHPTLFLLDELLSGTNSHDRKIGAQALVRGLVERGAIGMVTTHDLALASMADTLTGRAINVHFEDYLEGGEIRFDYHLRQGVVTRSNALELMRAVGLEV